MAVFKINLIFVVFVVQLDNLSLKQILILADKAIRITVGDLLHLSALRIKKIVNV